MSSPSVGWSAELHTFDVGFDRRVFRGEEFCERVLLVRRPNNQDRAGVGDRACHHLEEIPVLGDPVAGALLPVRDVADRLGKAYQFQIELKDGSPESAEEVLAKVNQIYRDALRHYFQYDEKVVHLATISKERFKPEKVAYVVEKLEEMSIIENKFEDDILGAFFEAIVRTGFKQEKGQFFTHTNIVRFIICALQMDEWVIEALNQPSPHLLYIMDPACGSGTFLVEAMKLITHSVLSANKEKLKKT